MGHPVIRWTKFQTGLSLAGVIRGQRVLDWGCGNGVLSLVAASSAASVEQIVGLDISPANVDAARANAELNRCRNSNTVFVRGDGFRPLEPFAWGNQTFSERELIKGTNHK